AGRGGGAGPGQPGRQRPEAPAEDNGVEAEQVARRREAEAGRAPRLVEGPKDALVAGVCPPDELGRDATHALAALDRHAGSVCDCFLADERLEAAAAPARATLAVGRQRHVPRLPAQPL